MRGKGVKHIKQNGKLNSIKERLDRIDQALMGGIAARGRQETEFDEVKKHIAESVLPALEAQAYTITRLEAYVFSLTKLLMDRKVFSDDDMSVALTMVHRTETLQELWDSELPTKEELEEIIDNERLQAEAEMEESRGEAASFDNVDL
jgi:hypothetical protein